MNPLPPQAYTKDTLVKAYAWLQSQSPSIKELATTPDVLVSLFLKTKLQGEGALERPSIQNFKNELKSLAGMMGAFEVVEPDNSKNADPSGQTIRVKSHHQSAPTQHQVAATQYQINPSPSSIAHNNTQELEPCQTGAPSLDLRSQEMIQEVKSRFNLSQESEVLRLLISVGYQQLKSLGK